VKGCCRDMASAGSTGGLRTNPMALLSDSDTSDDSSSSSDDDDEDGCERSPGARSQASASPSGLSARLKFEGRSEVLMPWERSSQGSRNGSVTPPSARARGRPASAASSARTSSGDSVSDGNASPEEEEDEEVMTGRGRAGAPQAERRVDTLMPWESDGPPPPSPVPPPEDAAASGSRVASRSPPLPDARAEGHVEPLTLGKGAIDDAPRGEAGRTYVFGGTHPEPEPEPEPEPPAGSGAGEIRREQEEVNLKIWAMSFNMECGDPFKQGQSDIDLHSFIPTNCDVYVVGLQEAGGEIKNVPPSPSAPGPAEPQDGLYNMIEMYLLVHRGCRRLRHTDATATGGVLESPMIAGRGDQSMVHPKFTSMAVYVREELMDNVKLCASCGMSFGVTEGSKGAVGMVLRVFGTTVCFVNCHLTANSGKIGNSSKRAAQYSAVVTHLGRKLGATALQRASSATDSGALGNCSFELNSLFHHVVWMGDMNFKLSEGITPEEAIALIGRREHETLHERFDTLTKLVKEGAVWYDYKEPTKMPHFIPTYKKKPYRAAITDHEDPGWVHEEYRTMYKEPWYKGGNTRPRVPGWCDRILYHSLRDLDTLLTPEKVSVDGQLAHNYNAVNDVLLCSDHSPVHAKFQLRTMWSPEEPTMGPSIYNIRLFDVIICDQTMSHTLSRYGEWQDTEWDSNMGRMVPIDRGHLDPPAPGESVSERKVRVQVPAPFELDGRVYEEKQFNMEHLLLEKEGEMFSFCGLNRGSIRPGAAHHLAIKFDICDGELPDVVSGARPASGQCVVRLPLTDFVSSNTLHFRELLIHNGLPVTDTGLEEDAETGEAVPTKVYADFKIHLVGDGGFHHDMADSFNKVQTDKAHSVRAPSSPSMVRVFCPPDLSIYLSVRPSVRPSVRVCQMHSTPHASLARSLTRMADRACAHM
jgi:hypothetical protein